MSFPPLNPAAAQVDGRLDRIFEIVKAQTTRQVFERIVMPLRGRAVLCDSGLCLYLDDPEEIAYFSQRFGRIFQEAVKAAAGIDAPVDFRSGQYLAAVPDAGEDSSTAPVPVPLVKADTAVRPPVIPEVDQLGPSIEIASAPLYEELVKPHRALVLPGYFSRWIAYLGPTVAWLVAGFWQAFYNCRHRQARPGVPFEATYSSLEAYGGVDRVTFWRYLDDPRVKYFLERLEPDAKRWVVDSTSGRAKQAPNRYRFVTFMPLTPGDAEALYNLFLEKGVRTDPVGAMKASLELEPKEILAYPPQPPGEIPAMFDAALSVQDVVRMAAGDGVSGETLKELSRLSDRLSERLIPSNDQIHIRHYFLKNWVRKLGHGPAWLVTILRDRCYVNVHTGEVRDRLTVKGGFNELACLLGSRRGRTVQDWILPPQGEADHELTVGSLKRRANHQATAEHVSKFLAVDYAEKRRGVEILDVRVGMFEPLTAEDEAIYVAAMDFEQAFLRLESPDRQQVLSSLGAWAREAGALETLNREDDEEEVGAAETLNDRDAGAPESVENRGTGAPEDLIALLLARRNLSDGEIRARQKLFKHLFKHFSVKALYGYLNHFVNPPSVLSDDRKLPDAWDLEQLLSANFNRKTVAELKTLGVEHQALVSYLLYLASPAGESAGLGWVVTHLKANPGQGAGETWNTLAALPAPILAGALLDYLAYRPLSEPAAAAWKAALPDAPHERVRELCRRLLLLPRSRPANPSKS